MRYEQLKRLETNPHYIMSQNQKDELERLEAIYNPPFQKKHKKPVKHTRKFNKRYDKTIKHDPTISEE